MVLDTARAPTLSSRNSRVLLAPLVCSLFFLFPGATHAADFRSGPELVVDQEVASDLYAAAAWMTISAPVKGDLIAAALYITMDGRVEEDFQAAAASIELSGTVQDDARLIAGRVDLRRLVEGDVLILAAEARARNSSVVGGDLILSAEDVNTRGEVRGALIAAGQRLDIGGTVKGDLIARGENIIARGRVLGRSTLAGRNIRVEPGAEFHGDVEYWSASGQVDFGDSIKGGRAIYNPDLELHDPTNDPRYHQMPGGSAGPARPTLPHGGARPSAPARDKATDWFSRWSILSELSTFIYWALAAALFLLSFRFLSPRLWAGAGARARDAWPAALGLGALYWLGVPFVALILSLTLIGAPLAAFVIVLYVIGMLLSGIVASMVLADWINVALEKNWGRSRLFLASLVCYAGLWLVGWVPVLGLITRVFLVFTAAGALILYLSSGSRARPRDIRAPSGPAV